MFAATYKIKKVNPVKNTITIAPTAGTWAKYFIVPALGSLAIMWMIPVIDDLAERINERNSNEKTPEKS